MKKLLTILFSLISPYVINADEREKSTHENNQTIIYFDQKEELNTPTLNLQINENASIEINTQSESHSYKIPKIITPDKELTIEIKMNNLLSVILNNIENKSSNTETEQSNTKKLKISISQNEYSIEFNLDKNIFPLIGFKAQEKILNPIISELYSEKRISKNSVI